ncbi:ferritin-like domain-containing protein [Mucilaginibacter terrenus]|uniref:Ferritin-like domain-containing protein n=1 Tax=Mucilaginibacter terrenus TaxID=2482727 RepID=A0A3E2NLG7_9SPHI|nr:ferritin-like domain-containing protein [Mucilaginibacter terrenus]RFZ81847.1 ferritin-like domain-containing protein [Mucilaginibacter terrenus]
MNLFNIIDEIQKVDPEINDRFNPRRAAIKNITSFGSKVAVAALPFALGTMFKKAYGAATTPVVDVLNFALTLEHLEAGFYNKGLSIGGFVPAGGIDAKFVSQIAADENKHVAFLKTVITQLGGTPVAPPTVDYTGGNNKGNGPFKDVFTNYTTFLTVGAAFEDTGVRAYKGQAPNLLGNQVVLTAALGIHAVEGRHASALRYLINSHKVGTTATPAIKPYIVSSASKGNDTGAGAADGNYAGEENTTQGGVNLSSLASIGVVTASFDEPLSKDEVLKLLVGSFIVTP